MAALARGDDQEVLDDINRAMFIRNNTFYTPAAVALLYVLGRYDEAAELLRRMQNLFPDLHPRTPIFYVTMKPIDDILATRREQGDINDPANVEEIYSILREEINN